MSLSEHVDRAWIDRLVNLQVLATHGDADAALTAEQWLAHDPEARALWASIDGNCRHVRAMETER